MDDSEPCLNETEFQQRPLGRPRKDRLAALDRACEEEAGNPKYRCCYYSHGRGKWQAFISIAGHKFLVGEFDALIPAAQAYDNARWFLQDFSRNYPYLNFPGSKPNAPSDRVLAIRARLIEQGYPAEYRHSPNFVAPALHSLPEPEPLPPERDDNFEMPLFEWRQTLAESFSGTPFDIREALLKVFPLAQSLLPNPAKISRVLAALIDVPGSGVEPLDESRWRISKL